MSDSRENLKSVVFTTLYNILKIDLEAQFLKELRLTEDNEFLSSNQKNLIDKLINDQVREFSNQLVDILVEEKFITTKDIVNNKEKFQEVINSFLLNLKQSNENLED